MAATESYLDIGRLEKVRRSGTKLTARCPACAAAGNDRRGNHLFINLVTGKFGCGAFPGDTDHRREIFAIVGIRGECRRDPGRDGCWKRERDEERRREFERTALIDAAAKRRAGIVQRWSWNQADIWDDSPQRIDCPLVEFDPRHFLGSLFAPASSIWTGEVQQSGQKHAARWKTVEEWHRQPESDVGPMVSPALWQPGTLSRSAANVAGADYTVLDFDELDGKKPQTPAEIETHLAASLAIVRWLRDGLGWQLAAVVWTGGRSVHAWFHHPGHAAVGSLKIAARPLGIDAGLIGRPEHPCRLPGQIHAKSGKISRVIWLQNQSY